MFFGTPRFTENNEWVQFFSAVERIKGNMPTPDFRDLNLIDEAFCRLPNYRDLKICCFYEELAIYRIGLVSNQSKLPNLVLLISDASLLLKRLL